MKIFFISALLLIQFLGKSQNLCLSTQCTATRVTAGSQALLGAVLTANAGVSAISFTFQSGPNTPMISGVNNSFADSAKIVDTGRVYINNLVVGTYLIKVVGTDKSGGITPPQYDSIVVSPAVVTTCPPQRTVTAISIVVFGVTLNITAGQGTKVTYSDGSTQSY